MVEFIILFNAHFTEFHTVAESHFTEFHAIAESHFIEFHATAESHFIEFHAIAEPHYLADPTLILKFTGSYYTIKSVLFMVYPPCVFSPKGEILVRHSKRIIIAGLEFCDYYTMFMPKNKKNLSDIYD